MSEEFAGKAVVITGAAGIYGSQLAENFAAAGARLFLTDRDEERLAALGAQLAPAEIALASAELTDADAIAGLCQQILEWSVPDVVVNNAGIYPFGGLFDTPVETWDRIMAVNMRAPFLITRALAEGMIAAQRKGAFIFIGSGAGQMLRTNGLAYCASKRGLEWLIEGHRAGAGAARHPRERRRPGGDQDGHERHRARGSRAGRGAHRGDPARAYGYG
jgi:3-oxoacyl-[acyl-carrier protein] reductase